MYFAARLAISAISAGFAIVFLATFMKFGYVGGLLFGGILAAICGTEWKLAWKEIDSFFKSHDESR
jgi:hypothetical protein